MKRWIVIFSFLVGYCTISEKSEYDQEYWILWWLFQQKSVPKIECIDIPPNKSKERIQTEQENCFSIHDPLFSYQWHFQNPLADLQMKDVWTKHCGKNVQIAIIDDGVDIHHEDLNENIEISKSFDYRDNDFDPTGNLEEDDSIHGTMVAGLIAAKDNFLGVRGVAPRSRLRVFNSILVSQITNIVDSIQRDVYHVWISNNSWGPVDKTGLLHDSPQIWKDAILHGLKEGRFGLGTIFLYAAGNGAYFESNGQKLIADNSNYDGYANFHGVIAVCAVGKNGKKAEYSENGANLWICAPSMGNDFIGLTTTDLRGDYGYNSKYISKFESDLSDRNYTKNFNGTSASTPLVSGAIALILQANPYLSWRDVKVILAKSATKNDPQDKDWKMNAAGYWINHKYGFGMVNVSKAVELASRWTPLGEYRKCKIENVSVEKQIPDNGNAIMEEISTTVFNIQKIEWVDIKVKITHNYWGDLLIQAYSPSGTEAVLMEPHNCSDGKNPIKRISCDRGEKEWSFGIARFLEESANGKFRISIQDKIPEDTGTFHSWGITIIGRKE
ncbi:MAG: S8 family serine peptidase [Leptospiraceae bacterium]|nr:S8 family serine peptidase [Leptospiraceae bacterium]MDW7976701.1 S8 family serine peptidase [Leptospiraceae bacterium]